MSFTREGMSFTREDGGITREGGHLQPCLQLFLPVLLPRGVVREARHEVAAPLHARLRHGHHARLAAALRVEVRRADPHAAARVACRHEVTPRRAIAPGGIRLVVCAPLRCGVLASEEARARFSSKGEDPSKFVSKL